MPKAERLLTALRRQVDRQNPIESSELSRLEGEVALARGHTRRALEWFVLAERQSANPLTVESLAHAYEKSGNIGQAVACYERLIGMGQRALGWEPQQSWIAAHSRLARAYLSRGDKAKAAAVIDALPRRWEDADADLPLVRELRQLQSKIKGGD